MNSKLTNEQALLEARALVLDLVREGNFVASVIVVVALVVFTATAIVSVFSYCCCVIVDVVTLR